MRKKLPFKRWLMAGALFLSGASMVQAQAVPPTFTRDCLVKNTETGECTKYFSNTTGFLDIQSLAVDWKSRLWIAVYSKGIAVRQPNGDPYELTSPNIVTATSPVDNSFIKQIKFGTITDNATTITGIGLAHDGNILVIVNSNILYKLNSVTGDPIARYVAPIASVAAPSSTADGRIYFGGVTVNRSFIIKQSTTDPTTFDLLEDFVLPNRVGFASRSAAISPSGNTIFYTGENTTLSLNIRNASNQWVTGGAISLTTTTRVSRPIDDDRLYSLSQRSEASPAAAATLNYHDRATPANSWVLPLPEVVDAVGAGTKDLRALAFSKNFDTVYVGSFNSGNLYRYIKKVTPTVPDYRISDARSADATTGVEANVGQNVRIKGVVTSANISGGDYNFFLAAKNDGAIQVFKADKGTMAYAPALGDSIAVMGKLAQNKGMLRIEVDSIRLISPNQPLTPTKAVTALVEAVEGMKVRFQDAVTLVNPAQWTTGQGNGGFGVEVQQGTQTFMVYIPSSSALYNMPAPSGELEVSGFVVQSKEDAPFTSGYFLMATSVQDVKYVAPGTLTDRDWCVGESVSLPVYAMGNASTSTVSVELSDAAGSFATPRVIGTFTGQGNGNAAVTVPQVANGTGYRIRLVLNDPALTNLLSESFTISTPVASVSQVGNVLTASEGDAYQWFRNGIAIGTATNRTFTATETGRYSVRVGATGGCQATSGVIAMRVVGEILPTYRRDCLERDPVTGECLRYFGTGFAYKAADFQALATDKQSKLWVALYGTGIEVRNPNGTRYQLSSSNLSYGTEPAGDQSMIKQIRFKGNTDAAGQIRSIATAHDGNILVIVGERTVYKLDAVTGEPIARWRGENTLALGGISSSADGRIFLHTVLGGDNTHFILQQSTTDPTTFNVVQNLFPVANRVGFASRSNSISPDGNTWLISSESTTVNVNERDANNNWVAGENIITSGNSKKAFAVDNNRVITLHEPIGMPASLNLHTRANATSPWVTQWSMHLEGMAAADADLRGLAFTPNLDTVYVGSYATGAIFRFIAQTPTNYTIAQVRPVNAQGEAEKKGEYVRLNGVVNTTNMTTTGFNFILMENGSAIQVFKPTSGGIVYTPKIGDNIEALGALVQTNGMLRLDVDYIRVTGTGGTVAAPVVVTTLSEANEAMLVRLEKVTLANSAAWTTGQGAGGFTVQVMKGTEAIDVFIPSSSPLYNRAAPAGEIEVDGIVMQSDATLPYTSGYYVMPRSVNDVKYTSTPALTDVQLCAGEVISLPIYAMGAGTSAKVTVEMSDKAGSFATPRTVGTFNGTGAGTVNITVPQVESGAGYRLRLMLESPALTYAVPQDLTVTNAPTPTIAVSQGATNTLTASEGQSYQWYFNGTAMAAPEGTARILTIGRSGMYKVEVKVNDCGAVSDEMQVLLTGVRNDEIAKQVELYPVPTDGMLYLKMPASIRKATRVQITDLAGRTISTQETKGSDVLDLDLGTQPAGVYLVILYTPEGKIVKRVVKR